MVPGADGIYYFEVTIIKGGGGKRKVIITLCQFGFCKQLIKGYRQQ
jgi:hypothetical protein